MSGPYREAFVELAQSAFDEIKALGEQLVIGIVKEAEKSAPATPAEDAAISRLNKDLEVLPDLIRVHLAYNYKRWAFLDTIRRADIDQTIIRVRLRCRHVGWFTICETRFASLAGGTRGEFYDYITGVLDGAPGRKCYCVPWEPPMPCTAVGVCK